MTILRGFWLVKLTITTKGNVGTNGKFFNTDFILVNIGKLPLSFLEV